MKSKISFNLISVLLVILTSAKVSVAHPNRANRDFYITQNPCEATVQTQSAMSACAAWKYEQADNTLNRLYRQLRSQLSSQNQNLLQEAQLSWIKFRDNECLFSVYSSRTTPAHSMGVGIQFACATALTEKRNQELEYYLQNQRPPSSHDNYQSADHRLNQVYQQAIRATGSPEKLREAQRAWIPFRDTVCNFESNLLAGRNSCLTRLTEERTERLSRIAQRH